MHGKPGDQPSARAHDDQPAQPFIEGAI